MSKWARAIFNNTNNRYFDNDALESDLVQYQDSYAKNNNIDITKSLTTYADDEAKVLYDAFGGNKYSFGVAETIQSVNENKISGDNNEEVASDVIKTKNAQVAMMKMNEAIDQGANKDQALQVALNFLDNNINKLNYNMDMTDDQKTEYVSNLQRYSAIDNNKLGFADIGPDGQYKFYRTKLDENVSDVSEGSVYGHMFVDNVTLGKVAMWALDLVGEKRRNFRADLSLYSRYEHLGENQDKRAWSTYSGIAMDLVVTSLATAGLGAITSGIAGANNAVKAMRTGQKILSGINKQKAISAGTKTAFFALKGGIDDAMSNGFIDKDFSPLGKDAGRFWASRAFDIATFAASERFLVPYLAAPLGAKASTKVINVMRKKALSGAKMAASADMTASIVSGLSETLLDTTLDFVAHNAIESIAHNESDPTQAGFFTRQQMQALGDGGIKPEALVHNMTQRLMARGFNRSFNATISKLSTKRGEVLKDIIGTGEYRKKAFESNKGKFFSSIVKGVSNVFSGSHMQAMKEYYTTTGKGSFEEYLQSNSFKEDQFITQYLSIEKAKNDFVGMFTNKQGTAKNKEQFAEQANKYESTIVEYVTGISALLNKKRKIKINQGDTDTTQQLYNVMFKKDIDIIIDKQQYYDSLTKKLTTLFTDINIPNYVSRQIYESLSVDAANKFPGNKGLDKQIKDAINTVFTDETSKVNNPMTPEEKATWYKEVKNEVGDEIIDLDSDIGLLSLRSAIESEELKNTMDNYDYIKEGQQRYNIDGRTLASVVNDFKKVQSSIVEGEFKDIDSDEVVRLKTDLDKYLITLGNKYIDDIEYVSNYGGDDANKAKQTNILLNKLNMLYSVSPQKMAPTINRGLSKANMLKNMDNILRSMDDRTALGLSDEVLSDGSNLMQQYFMSKSDLAIQSNINRKKASLLSMSNQDKDFISYSRTSSIIKNNIDAFDNNIIFTDTSGNKVFNDALANSLLSARQLGITELGNNIDMNINGVKQDQASSLVALDNTRRIIENDFILDAAKLREGYDNAVTPEELKSMIGFWFKKIKDMSISRENESFEYLANRFLHTTGLDNIVDSVEDRGDIAFSTIELVGNNHYDFVIKYKSENIQDLISSNPRQVWKAAVKIYQDTALSNSEDWGIEIVPQSTTWSIDGQMLNYKETVGVLNTKMPKGFDLRVKSRELSSMSTSYNDAVQFNTNFIRRVIPQLEQQIGRRGIIDLSKQLVNESLGVANVSWSTGISRNKNLNGIMEASYRPQADITVINKTPVGVLCAYGVDGEEAEFTDRDFANNGLIRLMMGGAGHSQAALKIPKIATTNPYEQLTHAWESAKQRIEWDNALGTYDNLISEFNRKFSNNDNSFHNFGKDISWRDANKNIADMYKLIINETSKVYEKSAGFEVGKGFTDLLESSEIKYRTSIDELETSANKSVTEFVAKLSAVVPEEVKQAIGDISFSVPDDLKNILSVNNNVTSRFKNSLFDILSENVNSIAALNTKYINDLDTSNYLREVKALQDKSSIEIESLNNIIRDEISKAGIMSDIEKSVEGFREDQQRLRQLASGLGVKGPEEFKDGKYTPVSAKIKNALAKSGQTAFNYSRELDTWKISDAQFGDKLYREFYSYIVYGQTTFNAFDRQKRTKPVGMKSRKFSDQNFTFRDVLNQKIDTGKSKVIFFHTDLADGRCMAPKWLMDVWNSMTPSGSGGKRSYAAQMGLQKLMFQGNADFIGKQITMEDGNLYSVSEDDIILFTSALKAFDPSILEYLDIKPEQLESGQANVMSARGSTPEEVQHKASITKQFITDMSLHAELGSDVKDVNLSGQPSWYDYSFGDMSKQYTDLNIVAKQMHLNGIDRTAFFDNPEKFFNSFMSKERMTAKIPGGSLVISSYVYPDANKGDVLISSTDVNKFDLCNIGQTVMYDVVRQWYNTNSKVLQGDDTTKQHTTRALDFLQGLNQNGIDLGKVQSLIDINDNSLDAIVRTVYEQGIQELSEANLSEIQSFSKGIGLLDIASREDDNYKGIVAKDNGQYFINLTRFPAQRQGHSGWFAISGVRRIGVGSAIEIDPWYTENMQNTDYDGDKAMWISASTKMLEHLYKTDSKRLFTDLNQRFDSLGDWIRFKSDQAIYRYKSGGTQTASIVAPESTDIRKNIAETVDNPERSVGMITSGAQDVEYYRPVSKRFSNKQLLREVLTPLADKVNDKFISVGSNNRIEVRTQITPIENPSVIFKHNWDAEKVKMYGATNETVFSTVKNKGRLMSMSTLQQEDNNIRFMIMEHSGDEPNSANQTMMGIKIDRVFISDPIPQKIMGSKALSLLNSLTNNLDTIKSSTDLNSLTSVIFDGVNFKENKSLSKIQDIRFASPEFILNQGINSGVDVPKTGGSTWIRYATKNNEMQYFSDMIGKSYSAGFMKIANIEGQDFQYSILKGQEHMSLSDRAKWASDAITAIESKLKNPEDFVTYQDYRTMRKWKSNGKVDVVSASDIYYAASKYTELIASEQFKNDIPAGTYETIVSIKNAKDSYEPNEFIKQIVQAQDLDKFIDGEQYKTTKVQGMEYPMPSAATTIWKSYHEITNATEGIIGRYMPKNAIAAYKNLLETPLYTTGYKNKDNLLDYIAGHIRQTSSVVYRPNEVERLLGDVYGIKFEYDDSIPQNDVRIKMAMSTFDVWDESTVAGAINKVDPEYTYGYKLIDKFSGKPMTPDLLIENFNKTSKVLNANKVTGNLELSKIDEYKEVLGGLIQAIPKSLHSTLYLRSKGYDQKLIGRLFKDMTNSLVQDFKVSKDTVDELTRDSALFNGNKTDLKTSYFDEYIEKAVNESIQPDCTR